MRNSAAVCASTSVGWDAAILSASRETARELRLRSYRSHELWNGAIPVRLLRIDLDAPGAQDRCRAARRDSRQQAAASAGAQMFANRLEKNLKRLAKEAAARGKCRCYRLYDADMPEYAFAIDRYEARATRARRICMCRSTPRRRASTPRQRGGGGARRCRRCRACCRSRRSAFICGCASARAATSNISASRTVTSSRAPAAFTVEEAGLKFLVNLDDYLDTGLFLDHRLTRARLRELRPRGALSEPLLLHGQCDASTRRSGGARSHRQPVICPTVTWTGRRIISAQRRWSRRSIVCERADCREWLRDARSEQFDLIFLDPPTFSNSKRMQGVLDVQRDHPGLIDQCMRLLAPGGRLVFSTNAQRFRLESRGRAALAGDGYLGAIHCRSTSRAIRAYTVL